MRKLIDMFKEQFVFEEKMTSMAIISSDDELWQEDELLFDNFVIVAFMDNGDYVPLSHWSDFTTAHEEFERYLQSDANEDFYFKEFDEDAAIKELSTHLYTIANEAKDVNEQKNDNASTQNQDKESA